MLITYTSDVATLGEEQLRGFFDGWQRRPAAATLLASLRGSQHAIVAVDSQNHAVGFITILTDGALSAYIPLLEVLPAYRRLGIGSELVGMEMSRMKDCYMLDLTCDVAMQSFYARLGWEASTGMSIRKYQRLAGA